MMLPVQFAAIALAATVAATSLPAAAQTYKDEPLPWRGSTKDDGYPVPQPPPAAYVPPPAPRHAPVAQCLSKHGIRNALNGQGWHAFDNVEIRGDVAYMTAEADNGRRFDLTIDNCSGEVLDSHPRTVYVEPPPVYYGGYYRPRPAIGFYYGGGYGHGYGHGRWR
jgi:hypothetical protein